MAFIELPKGSAGDNDVSVSITEDKGKGQTIRFGLGRDVSKEIDHVEGRVAIDFGYAKDFGKILLRPHPSGYAITGKGRTKSVSTGLVKAGITSDAMSPEVVKHELNPKGQLVITLPESVVNSMTLTDFGKRREVLAMESDTLNDIPAVKS